MFHTFVNSYKTTRASGTATADSLPSNAQMKNTTASQCLRSTRAINASNEKKHASSIDR